MVNLDQKPSFLGTARTLTASTPSPTIGNITYVKRSQQQHDNTKRTAVMQPGNMAKTRPSHLVTREADVGVSFRAESFKGPSGKQRTRTLKDADPELGHGPGVRENVVSFHFLFCLHSQMETNPK